MHANHYMVGAAHTYMMWFSFLCPVLIESVDSRQGHYLSSVCVPTDLTSYENSLWGSPTVECLYTVCVHGREDISMQWKLCCLSVYMKNKTMGHA